MLCLLLEAGPEQASLSAHFPRTNQLRLLSTINLISFAFRIGCRCNISFPRSPSLPPRKERKAADRPDPHSPPKGDSQFRTRMRKRAKRDDGTPFPSSQNKETVSKQCRLAITHAPSNRLMGRPLPACTPPFPPTHCGKFKPMRSGSCQH